MTIRDLDKHVLLGAFILGGLSEEDAQGFRDHLQSCLDCRQELDRLAGLPRLLELARPTERGRRASLWVGPQALLGRTRRSFTRP
jgi:hypothetical protein